MNEDQIKLEQIEEPSQREPKQIEELKLREEKEERRKNKEERRKKKALKKYSEMINYPGLNVEMQPATESDTELFNNLFDENQVICQNNIKRYVYCSTIFILYAAIGFMYYKFIY